MFFEKYVIERRDISSTIQEGYQDSIPKFEVITQQKGDCKSIDICKSSNVTIKIVSIPITKRGISNELKSTIHLVNHSITLHNLWVMLSMMKLMSWKLENNSINQGSLIKFQWQEHQKCPSRGYKTSSSWPLRSQFSIAYTNYTL
jgi:hypothetical protein